MSYTTGINVPFVLLASDFTSPKTRYMKAPNRCNRGRVVTIHCSVTTTFTQTTTPGYVRIGTAGTANLYAELNMGSAAANTAYNDTDVTGTIKKAIDLTNDGVSVIQLSTVAPTGGSPAGVADVVADISWF